MLHDNATQLEFGLGEGGLRIVQRIASLISGRSLEAGSYKCPNNWNGVLEGFKTKCGPCSEERVSRKLPLDGVLLFFLKKWVS